ncbi:M12 family metallopeptidase [Spirosoma foliorum]|uniref:M12 family metallopeptidase n=1 Tax=Spirosoma foliorum TaxID=2710596 RepID=A0A7G5H1B7_9BACT|nr:M12 family metallopeptidase [Spirosoma foliorum]QMW04909.1 M12 family metallopeptidase [Spirosoma foliorum]
MKTIAISPLLFAFTCSLLSCTQNTTEKILEITPVVKVTRPEEAFPLQQGPLKTGMLNGEKITYSLINGQAVFQSDILVSPDSINDSMDFHTQAIKGTGRKKLYSRWPNKTVYYTIDPELPNKARVYNAIAHWEANTSIRFMLRTTQRGYVLFRLGPGCSSNIGYAGGLQYINLANICSTGNTIHEIGHTVGLWHEHTRTDRDNYITINAGNITNGYETDFQTYEQRGMDGFNYAGGLDFGSIMLYGSFDFSRNGLPTITKKDGSTFIGQRQSLSATDIATVQSMYP